jgi:hypothetical protein
MEMGSVFLATSKSRIEEYLPPNFGQEIVIFPLSCDCDTLKALRIPIICSIAPFPFGDCHMEKGDLCIPWKSPFPYGDPCFHIGS